MLASRFLLGNHNNLLANELDIIRYVITSLWCAHASTATLQWVKWMLSMPTAWCQMSSTITSLQHHNIETNLSSIRSTSWGHEGDNIVVAAQIINDNMKILILIWSRFVSTSRYLCLTICVLTKHIINQLWSLVHIIRSTYRSLFDNSRSSHDESR